MKQGGGKKEGNTSGNSLVFLPSSSRLIQAFQFFPGKSSSFSPINTASIANVPESWERQLSVRTTHRSSDNDNIIPTLVQSLSLPESRETSCGMIRKTKFVIHCFCFWAPFLDSGITKISSCLNYIITLTLILFASAPKPDLSFTAAHRSALVWAFISRLCGLLPGHSFLRCFLYHYHQDLAESPLCL